jgi:hypothetical protein
LNTGHCASPRTGDGCSLRSEDQATSMKRILGLLGAFIGGWLGWWLGARFGFAAGVLLSTFAAGAGMYAAYRWFDQYLD